MLNSVDLLQILANNFVGTYSFPSKIIYPITRRLYYNCNNNFKFGIYASPDLYLRLSFYLHIANNGLHCYFGLLLFIIRVLCVLSTFSPCLCMHESFLGAIFHFLKKYICINWFVILCIFISWLYTIYERWMNCPSWIVWGRRFIRNSLGRRFFAKIKGSRMWLFVLSSKNHSSMAGEWGGYTLSTNGGRIRLYLWIVCSRL